MLAVQPPPVRVLAPALGLGCGGLALGLLAGSEVLAGLTVGVTLVSAYFLTGRVPLALGPLLPPALALVLLWTWYLLRLALLLVALRGLSGVGWLDEAVLGGTLVGLPLVWLGAQLRAHLRAAPVAAPTPAAVVDGTADSRAER